MNSSERFAQASSIHAQGMERVRTTPPPKKQKYKPGTRVLIAKDLGPSMSHFPGKGQKTTVLQTYAHAYGGDDVKSYSLDIDGYGEVAWYYESQLTPITDNEPQENSTKKN